jgi:hypothetical protein
VQSLAHAGLHSTANISGAGETSTVPPGRGVSASLSRYFVPGDDRAVPPGQIHSTSEASLELAVMRQKEADLK